MSFKYINPGYSVGDLVGTTTTDNNYDTGMRMKINNKNFILPAGTKSVYVSFQANFSHYYNEYLSCCAYTTGGGNKTGAKYIGSYDSGAGVDYYYVNNAKNEIQAALIDEIGRGYLEIVSDATNGVFRGYVNGKVKFEFTGNVMNGLDIEYLNFDSSRISSIIISDEPFPITEKMVKVTAANTTGTMTANSDGSYTATEAGQSIMQTIDAAALEQKIGVGNTITGIALIGSPAYYDGDGLSKIAAMKGEEEKAEVNLSTNTTNNALASWKDNISQGNLSNISFGWKAKA